MRKISKRTREQAALICAIAASMQTTPHDVAFRLGISGAPLDLATEAADFAGAYAQFDAWEEFDAECEALLRTGWTPPGWR